MGLRFDLSVANWIAFVIDERADVPQFASASAPATDASRMALDASCVNCAEGSCRTRPVSETLAPASTCHWMNCGAPAAVQSASWEEFANTSEAVRGQP